MPAYADSPIGRPVQELTWAQVLAWRAKSHFLQERVSADRLLEVAGALCGLHAQLLSSAEMSLWARLEDYELGQLGVLLWEKRTLVKTWAMRGTLHILPSSEWLSWQPSLHVLYRERMSRFIRGEEEYEALMQGLAHALYGRTLTREQLATEVSLRTRRPGLANLLLKSWGTMLKPAAFRGDLCFAPNLGRYVRFTHPSSWLKLHVGASLTPDESLRWVTRRYLRTYGPAVARDYGHWLGVGLRRAGKLIETLGQEVDLVDVEGTRAWILSSDTRSVLDLKPTKFVRLLPAFDPWVVAEARVGIACADTVHRKSIYRPQGWISPVLLINGRMEGIWHHEVRGRQLYVWVDPFSQLPKWAHDGLGHEVERLARLLTVRLKQCKVV